MIEDALRFWDAIKGKVKRIAREETRNAFRCERYEVTTAPNGTTVGVTLPMGTKEIFLPYSTEVATATAGQSVLVVWWGSMSNAKVCYYADGYRGGGGGGGGLTIEQIRDTFWPIGSYYWSDNNVSPASFMGGYWEAIEDVFLLAAGDAYPAGSTGGEAAVTLTANQSGLRSHAHGSGINSSNQTTNFVRVIAGATVERKTVKNGTSTSQSNIVTSTQAFGPVTTTASVAAANAAEAHNNMPPYVAKYCWHRVAPPA